MSLNKANHHQVGVSVGAVRIRSKYAQAFRNVLNKTLGREPPIRFRGVDRLDSYSSTCKKQQDHENENEHANDVLDSSSYRTFQEPWLLIHLPPLVASALDDCHPEIMKFLNQHSATYLSGLRRKKKNKQSPPKKFSIKEDRPSQQHKQMGEEKTQVSSSISSTFTFVELFAGIGGFRLGLERIGGKCVLSSEVSPHAASIYRENFEHQDNQQLQKDHQQECLVEGDVLDLDTDYDFPETFDMLTGGFPCQPFTNRGNRRGFEDDRGQMYRELVRVLHNKQPPCFLFENVPGLVTMDGGSRGKREKGDNPTLFQPGAVFKRILKAFESSGYRVSWRVINSWRWLPQQRERVYIVGIRNDLCGDDELFEWDALVGTKEQTTKNGDPHICTVRDILEHKDCPSVMTSELSSSQWQKIQDMHAKKKQLSSTEYCIDINGDAPTLISNYHRIGSFSTKFVFEQSDGTPCDGVGTHRRPRFLTPRECCRIMGFPESFKVPSLEKDGSDKVAHFYHGIGNAVTPPVIASIGGELIKKCALKT